LTTSNINVLFLFLSAAPNMKDRHTAGLAERAEMGLSLARDLHACALAAEPEAKAELALAFQRVSRSVRQTYALEQRLERERRLADKDIAAQAERERMTGVLKKRRQVRAAVEPLIWTEYEGDEAEDLSEALEALVSDQALDEDAFLDAPLEACVEAIRTGLGLPAANDDPPDGDAPRTEVVIRRGSG
jgi:hypothetical protein